MISVYINLLNTDQIALHVFGITIRFNIVSDDLDSLALIRHTKQMLLPAEKLWALSDRIDLHTLTQELGVFCSRPMRLPPDNLVQSVHTTRQRIKAISEAFIPYVLAVNYGAYALNNLGVEFPLWLHSNDVPTMQAAHARNPDLEAYLRHHARTWSSNYIASDLRCDVWAARVILNLFNIKTPCLAKRPTERPRAEAGFVYDAARVVSLLDLGMSPREAATELGVGERFLRDQWKSILIDPTLKITRDRAHTHPLNVPSTTTNQRKAWLAKIEACGWLVENVSSAADAWGVTYQGARRRLEALGWRPGASVAEALNDAHDLVANARTEVSLEECADHLHTLDPSNQRDLGSAVTTMLCALQAQDLKPSRRQVQQTMARAIELQT